MGLRLTDRQPRGSNKPPTAGQAAIKAARERHGFLTPADVQAMADDVSTRLEPCLVRCGGCRFTAPAQDVKHLIDIITAEGRDYVRDVSLPATER